MIRIDNISFEFTTPDEKFAHELYAGWDVFCRHCFEQVVEECLSTYDKEKVLYEIEQLELDLGSIPEEYFYREFPRRLKEVLLKALPTGGLQRKSETEENGGSRLDNLLFYLEYGYPKAEWADEDFSLSEELGWLLSHSAPEQYIIRIASLCLEKEHVFHRLLWQADNADVLLRIYAASLSEPSAGLHGKHRFLTRLLETRPGIPVRFIHEATDDASLGEMAELLDSVSQTLATRDQLELENRALRQELLLKNSDLLMLGQYKQENARLRELLGSPLRQDEQKMVTQVISTVNDPYSDQVVIDKGSVNGVYEGQPVISDKGVVGQVVAVAKMTSRVLLICDATHALPIQVLRNDIRVIAAGNGCTDDLQLEHLPANTDIRVGDVLVTSGLGGRFPEGYPVGVVSSVKLDTQRAYTVIQARPTAGLQRLRYLLLLWGADRNGANPMTPEEVHRVANERLMQMMPQVLPAPDAMGPQMPAPATGLTPPQPSQPAGGQ